MKKFVYRLKTQLQNVQKKFKEKPKSKRKSFMIGFTTVVGIFGITLLGPKLSAVAKDIPKGSPKPTDLAPAPAIPPNSELINTGLSGFAGTVIPLLKTKRIHRC